VEAVVLFLCGDDVGYMIGTGGNWDVNKSDKVNRCCMHQTHGFGGSKKQKVFVIQFKLCIFK